MESSYIFGKGRKKSEEFAEDYLKHRAIIEYDRVTDLEGFLKVSG